MRGRYVVFLVRKTNKQRQTSMQDKHYKLEAKKKKKTGFPYFFFLRKSVERFSCADKIVNWGQCVQLADRNACFSAATMGLGVPSRRKAPQPFLSGCDIKNDARVRSSSKLPGSKIHAMMDSMLFVHKNC
jgi:hypothetical protein